MPLQGSIATRAAPRPLSAMALAYAERMHAGQLRSDGTPYITHAREVAALLRKAGASDQLIAAGALHDVLEKTRATPAELRRRFGSHITRLVMSVTDDEKLEVYEARKAALRRQVAAADRDTLELYAADKLSKVRELSRVTELDHRAHRRPDASRARRLRHYQRSLVLLERRQPGSPLVRDLRSEFDALTGARASR